MWAGDQTTLADTYDFVWKESMAEYLAFAYEDMSEPTVGAAHRGVLEGASATARVFFPVPGDKPALFDYYGDVYGPGPMVLFRQLEVLTSREQVLAGDQERARPAARALGRRRGRRARGDRRARSHGVRRRVDQRHRHARVAARTALTYTPAAGTSTLALTQIDRRRRGAASSTSRSRARSRTESQLVEVDTFNGRRRSDDHGADARVHGDVDRRSTRSPSASCSPVRIARSTRVSRQPVASARALRISVIFVAATRQLTRAVSGIHVGQ